MKMSLLELLPLKKLSNTSETICPNGPPRVAKKVILMDVLACHQIYQNRHTAHCIVALVAMILILRHVLATSLHVCWLVSSIDGFFKDLTGTQCVTYS